MYATTLDRAEADESVLEAKSKVSDVKEWMMATQGWDDRWILQSTI
jgi:hypothetical protein